ncbi:hypothetical protein B0H13DRAFT_1896715 [Mycena leptocephala]|nr:hypothetical protein B0H13DRAFT_1896715 [Mycena leptocephala]
MERDCEAGRPANSYIRRQQIQQWAASVNCEMDNSWDIPAQKEFVEAQRKAPMRPQKTDSEQLDQNDTLKWIQAVCSSLVRPVWIQSYRGGSGRKSHGEAYALVSAGKRSRFVLAGKQGRVNFPLIDRITGTLDNRTGIF